MTKLSGNTIRVGFRLAFAIACIAAASAQSCADSGGGINNSFDNNADFNNEVPGCVVDDDCNAGSRCASGSCSPSCDNDADCDSGEICATEIRGEAGDTVDVCVTDTEPEPIECRFDADCQETFDDPSARCGIDGICFVPERTSALLVTDLTDLGDVDLTSPAEDGGHGADIAAIYIADADGEPTAWAETIEAVPANDVVLRNAPDGEPRTLAAGTECVSGTFEQMATPLGGDSGYMLVRFRDVDSGKVVNTAPPTWNVRIVEWGANCPGGEVDVTDVIEVRGCTGVANEPINTARDCETVLGSGSGYLEIGP